MTLVPQTRLLIWFAAVTPFSLVATLGETGLITSAIILGTLVLAALIDAARAATALQGIHVELPPVVRFARDRSGEFEVRVRNPRQNARRLRVGFALPEQLGPAKENETILLPAGTEWSSLR